MPERWLSVYLDLPSADPVLGDAMLADLVAPLVGRLRSSRSFSRWFFIRYRDPTPHLRLRVRTAGDRMDGIGAEIRAAAARDPDVSPVRLRFEPYEPELERYGGPAGVAIAERMFQVSSDMVLPVIPLLRSAHGPEERRLAHGALGAALLVATLLEPGGPEERAGFLERYERRLVGTRVREDARERFSETYQTWAGAQATLVRTLAPAVAAADRPELLPEPVSTAVRGFHDVRRALLREAGRRPLRFRGRHVRTPAAALRMVTGSYLHMHLNRLGIGPIREPLVCKIAREAFREEPAWA